MTREMTQDQLREALDYSPLLGLFRHRPRPEKTAHDKTWNTRYANTIAGHKETKGYIRISIDGQSYKAHRLAWLYMTGAWPIAEIDHINGVKDDNRFENLREATRTENIRNQARPRTDNTSGIPGVNWHKKFDKWRVRIQVHGKRLSLGYFTDLSDAIAARKAAEIQHFGAFASKPQPKGDE